MSRTCSVCHQPGHNKATCKVDQPTMIDPEKTSTPKTQSDGDLIHHSWETPSHVGFSTHPASKACERCTT